MSAPGWVFPTPTARKCHYFAADEERSLCGKYGRIGDRLPVEPDTGVASPSDCLACHRRLPTSAARCGSCESPGPGADCPECQS